MENHEDESKKKPYKVSIKSWWKTWNFFYKFLEFSVQLLNK